eukprot:195694_1
MAALPKSNGPRFAVFSCDKTTDFASMFVTLLAGPGQHWDIWKVFENEFPSEEKLRNYDGILITGSESNAHDLHIPWIARLSAMCKSISENPKQRLLGVCFGHQVVANALGGKSGRAPIGWRLGNLKFELLPQFFDRFDEHSVSEENSHTVCFHQDQILELPANAKVLARHAGCPYSMLLVGDNVLTNQSHPEFDTKFAKCLTKNCQKRGFITTHLGNAALITLDERHPNQKLDAERSMLSDYSKNLDKMFDLEEGEQEDLKRILLLGAGESGKSTIFKQMTDLYTEGRTDEDRLAVKPSIVLNIFNGIKLVFDAAEDFEADPDIKGTSLDSSEELRQLKEKVVDAAGAIHLDEDIVDSIKKLWASDEVKKVLDNRSKFQCPDSLEYFIESIDRIVKEGYLPNNQDILRCRVRTTGANDIFFSLEGVQFKMTDVGGQRSERKKWVSFMDNMHAVLFIVGVSEYDQVLFEDASKNRLIEALDLFEGIVNRDVFHDSDIILFLNKHDLFAKKLKKVPLTTLFEDYEGDPDSVDEALDFIRQAFEERNDVEGKDVYTHQTTGIDPENVKHVFHDVKDIVVKDSLKSAGFM